MRRLYPSHAVEANPANSVNGHSTGATSRADEVIECVPGEGARVGIILIFNSIVTCFSVLRFRFAGFF